MARYEHLPIYKAAYVLSRETYRLQEKLPRGLRYSLGSMAFQCTLRCIRGVIVANNSPNKTVALQTVMLEAELLWTYFRMLYDFKGISKGEFHLVSERLSALSAQLHAWIRWEKAQIRKNGHEEKVARSTSAP